MDSISPQSSPPAPPDRYHVIVGLLQQIIQRLEIIEHDVDELDRALRPYGDGTRLRGRRAAA